KYDSINARKKILISALASLTTGAAFAQAPVIDLNEQRQHQETTWQAQPQPAPTYPTHRYRDDMYAQPSYSLDDEIRVLRQQVNTFIQLDLPGKVDVLQQQIQELNGRLEVQAHQIEALTEQQKSFYQ